MTSFSIGPTLEVGELSLTVIERTSIDRKQLKQGILLQARKEPFAVLVRKADAAYAIGMDGTSMTTSQLAETGVSPV